MSCILIFNSLISQCKADSEIVIQRDCNLTWTEILIRPTFCTFYPVYAIKISLIWWFAQCVADYPEHSLECCIQKNSPAASIALLQPEELLPCTWDRGNFIHLRLSWHISVSLVPCLCASMLHYKIPFSYFWIITIYQS